MIGGVASVLAVGVGAAGVAIATGSNEPEVTVSAKVSTAFPALASAQDSQDVLRASTPDNVPAAAQISKTSRLVADGAYGKVYAFVSADGKPCVIVQDTPNGVGGSGCAESEASGTPGVIAYRQPTGTATVAGLVREGVSSVSVVRDGTAREQVDAKSGGFAYNGKTPFRVTWSDATGEQAIDVADAPDVQNLKRAEPPSK